MSPARSEEEWVPLRYQINDSPCALALLVIRSEKVMNQPHETVIVVDDDSSVRSALASLIRSVGLEVELFATAEQLLGSPRLDEAVCLVLDVRLPGGSGLDVQRQLASAGLPVPIIFMTGYGDIPMSVKAIKAGAVEFLPKPFREQDLLDAIHQAIERDRARRAEDRDRATLRARFEALTRREQEVMVWVISGRLNKQIAAELGTSEVTVKIHRSHMMRKMQAASIADLVHMAARLGLRVRT
jgi:FixJ family two-component response regulator